MYPKSLSKEKTANLDLNTLPDFMKEPNPQVKFHSAFPPLSTKVRVRSVMERAGFDVYKPDKSRQASSRSAFEKPPKKGPFRSHSQGNLLNNYEKPTTAKSRNFTTHTSNNNSSPNLPNQYSSYSNSSSSQNYPNTGRERIIADYANEKLDLPTNKMNTTVPDVSHNIAHIAPIVPHIEMPHSNNSFGDNLNDSDDSIIYNKQVDSDLFNASTVLPPKQTPQINGPRPFIESDDEDQNNEPLKYHSRGSSALTTATNELNDHLYDTSNDHDVNNNINSYHQQVIPTIETEHVHDVEVEQQPDLEHENNLYSMAAIPATIPHLNVVNSDSTRLSRLSNASATSMSSFDAKFMNQNDEVDNDDIISHNSYGGLRDIRSTFQSADFDQYNPNTQSPKKNYENGKRLSTLSTNDMRIYNLQSLDNQHGDMSMIQEADNEHSRISVPDIVLEDEHPNHRNSFDELENDNIEAPFSESREVKGIENHEAYDTDSYHTNDATSLISKGFQKRTASAVSTPNVNQEPSNTLPESHTVIPLVPTLNLPPNEQVSNLINDLDNFQLNNEPQTLTTPSHLDSSPVYSQATQTPMSQESYPTTVEDLPETKFSTEITNEFEHAPGEGPCRKCHLDILDTEKKIWSKDHQLTGQWHRKCFGCTKCGSKFNKGSSCYVFNNEPYCEAHFHELNGSLCKICDKGVEGECLQNDVNEAFHIHCLTCVICGLSVQGDYFLFRGEVMCENDAKELMFQIDEAENGNVTQDSIDKAEKMIKRRTRVLYL